MTIADGKRGNQNEVGILEWTYRLENPLVSYILQEDTMFANIIENHLDREQA